MNDEAWKPIDFAPGYEVSDHGNVRSVEADGVVRPRLLTKFRDGHLVINIRANGKHYFCGVHRLVAVAFIGPAPVGKNQVCHIDGDPANNRLANLKWGSAAENTADRIRHGRAFTGERKIVRRLTAADAARVHQLRSEGAGLQEIADELNVSFSHVSAIIGGRRWACVKAG